MAESPMDTERVKKLLTSTELEGLKRGKAIKQLTDAFHALPPTEEFAAAAIAGNAKRGWYRNAAEAVTQVFGPDAPRFTALMAALSPQTSVQMNFHNAVRTFVNWDKAGRPTSANAIKKIMDGSVLSSEVKGPGSKSPVLPAWFPNAVRALTSKDPEKLQLSGPKVDSFMRNLQGHVNEVTNDAWMAAFSKLDPKLLGGLKRADLADDLSKTFREKSPQYMALSAKVREAAHMLTQLTGDTWTPREVQETVWSWAKTASEHADAMRKLAGTKGDPYNGIPPTIPELVKNGHITDDLIRSTPGFHDLFSAPQHREFLRSSRYGENSEQLANGPSPSAQPAPPVQASPAAQEALRPHLLSAAERLEQVRNAQGSSSIAARARLSNALQNAGMRGALNGSPGSPAGAAQGMEAAAPPDFPDIPGFDDE
jgi:hypothetical protein